MSNQEIEIVDDPATGFIPLSKRQGSISVTIKNTSNVKFLTVTIKAVTLKGLRAVIEDSDMIENFSPGEVKTINASVVLPAGVSFDPVETQGFVTFGFEFETTRVMSKESYDALPEWS